VTESYVLRHVGAELVDGFTRVHLMRDAALGGVAAVHALPAALPAAATRVTFRDELGNISTSTVVRTHVRVIDALLRSVMPAGIPASRACSRTYGAAFPTTTKTVAPGLEGCDWPCGENVCPPDVGLSHNHAMYSRRVWRACSCSVLAQSSFRVCDAWRKSREVVPPARSHSRLPPCAHRRGNLWITSVSGGSSHPSTPRVVSQARSGEGGALAVTLRPRHPLFGGWRTAFTLGYRLPAPKRSGEDAAGAMTVKVAAGAAVRGLSTDSATLVVVLPAGSQRVKLQTAAGVDVPYEPGTAPTVLGSGPRPTLTLRRADAVDDGAYP
jgi:hypothetical protein